MSLLYKSFDMVGTWPTKKGFYPGTFYYAVVITRLGQHIGIFSENLMHWNYLDTGKPVSKYMNRFIAKQQLKQTYKDYAAEAASLLKEING